MRRNGRQEVLEYLDRVSGATAPDIVRETGLALRTVQNICGQLIACEHPAAERIQGWKRRRSPCYDDSEQRGTLPSADEVVAKALSSRHPLDAWLL